MNIQSMDDVDLIRMVGDELHRHNDDTPLMEALDELLRRVPVMRECCESVAHDDKFTQAGAERYLRAIQAYRALRDRNSVTTDTKPSNTDPIPDR